MTHHRVLVTGGSGFVGANLCIEVAARGSDVTCLDVIPPPAALQSVTKGSAPIEYVSCDVSDSRDLGAVLARVSPSAVVHAAAITVLEPEVDQHRYEDLVRVNILGTANLLSALPSTVERVLLVSSASVYGPTSYNEVIRETRPPSPSNLYGVTKLAAEFLCRDWGQARNADVRIVRLSNVYGRYERETPSSHGQSLPFFVAHDLLRGRTPYVGNESHDWTYVTDVAHGIIDILDAETANDLIYNVSAGIPVPDARLADLLETALRTRGLTSPNLGPTVDRSGLAPKRGVLASRRIRTEFGYETDMTPDASVDAYVEWIANAGFREGFFGRT